MPVTELNHFLIRANKLERTKDFYCKVLGFEVMPRPDFPFPGYWLGINGKIQVHMAQGGVPNSQLYQLIIKDHDGLTIELNLYGITQAPDWRGEEYSKRPRASSMKATKKKK